MTIPKDRKKVFKDQVRELTEILDYLCQGKAKDVEKFLHKLDKLIMSYGITQAK